MLYLILTLLAVSVDAIDEFVITGIPAVKRASENVTFSYRVNPWPPPYNNNEERAQFENVYLKLYHPDATQLCEVLYYQGKWSSSSSRPCSSYNSRMFDYYHSSESNVNFEMAHTVLQDTGNFTLRIEYGMPTASGDLMLDVHVPPALPVITPPGLNEKVFLLGETLQVTCTVTLTNPPANLNWYKNGVRVTHDPSQHYLATDWQDTSSLWINIGPMSSRDHGTSYSCEADNGEKTENAFVVLVQHNNIVLQPCQTAEITYFVIENNDAAFKCEISAYPEYGDVTWKHDGEDIQMPTANTTSLTLQNVITTHSGTYTCSADNADSVAEGACNLDVQYGAKISVPSSNTINENDNYSLDCVYDANPLPYEVFWSKADDSNFRVNNSRLTIVSASPSDMALYTCHVNSLLTPTGKPEVTYTGLANVQININYTPFWVQFALTKFTGVVSEVAVLECHVQSFPSATYTWLYQDAVITNDDRRMVTTDGSTISTLKIQGLAPSELGEYNCRVENSVARREFSVQLLEPGKPDAPQTCEVAGIVDSTLTIDCIPGYDGGALVQLVIQHEKTNGKTETLTSVTNHLDAENLVRCQVTGLEPNTAYRMFVFAENSYGQSSTYVTVMALTQDFPPPPTAAPLDIGSIIGGVIGGIILICVIFLCVYILINYGCPSLPESFKNKGSRHKLQQQEQANRRSINRYGPELSLYAGMNEGFSDDYVDLQIHRRDTQAGRHDNRASSASTRPLQGDYEYALCDDEAIAPDDRPGDDYLTIMSEGSKKLQTNDYDTVADVEVILAKHRSLVGQAKSRVSDVDQYEVIQNVSHDSLRNSDIQEDATEVSMYSDISPHDLQLIQVIGQGRFTDVWKAKLTRLGATQPLVAVKTLKDGASDRMVAKMCDDIITWQHTGKHPSILAFYGSFSTGPHYIVTELSTRGPLLNLLRESRETGEINHRQLIIFALQISEGLRYLSSKMLLHRDIATRRVLLDSRLTCKLSNFGTAREVLAEKQHLVRSQTSLPVRWMAPESLKEGQFSVQSDVWAFGVTCWEIITLGSTPFAGINARTVIDIVVTGRRLQKPAICGHDWYTLMMDCWHDNPAKRPTFIYCRDMLETILARLDQERYENTALLSVASMYENFLKIETDLVGELC